MRATAEILRELPYFADLPEDLVVRVCEQSKQMNLKPGVVIIEEGSESEEMYVVVRGELLVTKRAGTKEVELGHIHPGEVVGEIALLDNAPRTATVKTSQESHLIEVPVSAFEDLLKDPHVIRRMFRTVTSRLRGIEDTLRHEERMSALGRMAAQLMHELNNPAAAVGRSTQELIRIYDELGEEVAVLAGALVGDDGLPSPTPPEELSSLDRADREDEVADWLADHDVPGPWELSPALVDAGWTPKLLTETTAGMTDDHAKHLARWIGLQVSAEQMIGEISIGARRISELVRIVKEYSYLDQAPMQEVDITEGLNDTLILMKGKLRDIDVTTDYADDLATLVAPGRDLNQVWTNLIDNAAHAMNGRGSLKITARSSGDDIVVEVSDSGPGMRPEVVERIFDPFYTTKEPGEGTGLGLHTVHTIIGRIGGEIDVDSTPEGTTFTVVLPAIS